MTELLFGFEGERYVIGTEQIVVPVGEHYIAIVSPHTGFLELGYKIFDGAHIIESTRQLRPYDHLAAKCIILQWIKRHTDTRGGNGEVQP